MALCDHPPVSTDLAKTAKNALLELAPSPMKAIAIMLGGLLGRPDLNEVATAALQEDVVRLHQRIEEAVSNLSDEVRAKIDPLEALELTIQTVANMGRTAQQEKRALMTHVLVNGLTHPEHETTERRLFVRAVADLDVAHIELLRKVSASAIRRGDETEVSVSLLTEMVSMGLITQAARGAGDRHGRRTEYRISNLGRRFVGHLQEPA